MNWYRRFMYGRNGADPLNWAVMVALMVLLVLSHAIRIPLVMAVTQVLYWLLAVLFFFRTFSKNIYRRREENMRYCTILRHVKDWFRLRKKMAAEAGTHKYLRCPRCGQRLRVPRGKGQISVRCAKCGEEFQRKV